MNFLEKLYFILCQYCDTAAPSFQFVDYRIPGIVAQLIEDAFEGFVRSSRNPPATRSHRSQIRSRFWFSSPENCQSSISEIACGLYGHFSKGFRLVLKCLHALTIIVQSPGYFFVPLKFICTPTFLLPPFNFCSPYVLELQ